MIHKILLSLTVLGLTVVTLSCGRGLLNLGGSVSSGAPAIPTPTPSTRFVYVANADFGVGVAVYVCAADPVTEAITSCQSAGGGAAILGVGVQGIELNHDHTTAYLTNGAGAANIYQCPINIADGTFGTCIQSAVTVTNSGGAYNGGGYGMLTMNAANTIAYLVDDVNNDRIDACPVSGSVIDSAACTTSSVPNTGSQAGEGIILNKANNTMYIADYSDGIYICNVSGSTIGSCILKIGGGAISLTSIADIALNPSENLLYVTSYGSNKVYACDTTPNGTNQFANCVVATGAVNNAGGVVINAKNTMAYVSTFQTSVYSCPILAGGTFGTCTATNGFHGAIGMALGY